MKSKKASLDFQVQLDGKGVKALTAKSMGSIWTQYNTYAKRRGFTKRVENNSVFGLMYWANSEGQKMTLVKVAK